MLIVPKGMCLLFRRGCAYCSVFIVLFLFEVVLPFHFSICFVVTMPIPASSWFVAMGPLGQYLMQENAALQLEINRVWRLVRDAEHRNVIEITEAKALLDNERMRSLNFHRYAQNLENQVRKMLSKANRLRLKKNYCVRLLRQMRIRNQRLVALARANQLTVHMRDIPESHFDSLDQSTEDELDTDEDEEVDVIEA